MPKKPKLTKEEKETLKRAEEERKLLEEELARQQAEEEERQRLERERLEKEERERIRLEEAAIREVQQQKLKVILSKLKETIITNKKKIWYDIEWDHLMKRSQDPDPLDVLVVNGYVCEWAYDEDESTEDILKGIVHCLLLISDIDIALVYFPGVTEKDESSWELNRRCMQDVIAQKLDIIIFELLMDSNEHINPDSYNSENTFFYHRTEKETPEDEEPLLSVCIWVNLAENLRYRGMESTAMGVSFEIPRSLITEKCAVAMMHTAFDHVSPSLLSPKSYLPLEKPDEVEVTEAEAAATTDEPEGDKPSADEVNADESETDKPEADDTEAGQPDAGTPEGNVDNIPEVQEPAEDLEERSTMVEMVPESVTSLSASAPATPFASHAELPQAASSTSMTALVEPEPDMVDFSGYYVIGGIFHFMLMEVPRLPVKAGAWIMTYSVEGDEKPTIKKRHYKATIIPIRQPRPGMSPAEAAEFADAEIRRFESEMLEAISVTIRLPKSVLFLEHPIPTMWLPEKNGFTTSGFFDVKYEEQNGTLSFKINQFSKIGIMTKKYANFPFQSWELKPGKDSHHSILTINGALVLLKIEISEKGASILSINHGDSALFQHLCGSFMAPWQLVQKLSSVGINILAEDDGFQHIGVQPKTSRKPRLVDEKKKEGEQENPGSTSPKEELEGKEADQKVVPPHVMVTPERAVYLKCGDTAEEFSSEAVDGQVPEKSAVVEHCLEEGHRILFENI